MSLDKSLWNQWAVLPLRLIIGFGFMAHGWASWSRGPEKFGELLHQIGLPFPGSFVMSSGMADFGGYAERVLKTSAGEGGLSVERFLL